MSAWGPGGENKSPCDRGEPGFLNRLNYREAFFCCTHCVCFQRVNRQFFFAELFVFLRQMVLQFPLQGNIDEALSYDLHRFVEMSLR